MKINKHDLIRAQDAGNGYHGYCKHCGAPLVTDLGYCSWTGVQCIDRDINTLKDIPDRIRSLASFKGLIFEEKQKVFIKPYSVETYTVDQLNTIITQL
jgi:hypothetical protein